MGMRIVVPIVIMSLFCSHALAGVRDVLCTGVTATDTAALQAALADASAANPGGRVTLDEGTSSDCNLDQELTAGDTRFLEIVKLKPNVRIVWQAASAGIPLTLEDCFHCKVDLWIATSGVVGSVITAGLSLENPTGGTWSPSHNDIKLVVQSTGSSQQLDTCLKIGGPVDGTNDFHEIDIRCDNFQVDGIAVLTTQSFHNNIKRAMLYGIGGVGERAQTCIRAYNGSFNWSGGFCAHVETIARVDNCNAGMILDSVNAEHWENLLIAGSTGSNNPCPITIRGGRVATQWHADPANVAGTYDIVQMGYDGPLVMDNVWIGQGRTAVATKVRIRGFGTNPMLIFSGYINSSVNNPFPGWSRSWIRGLAEKGGDGADDWRILNFSRRR